jgi:hypothetical protein
MKQKPACMSVGLSTFACLSVCLSNCLSVCLSVYLSVCSSFCHSLSQSAHVSHLSISLSHCLSVSPSVRPSACLSVSLFVRPSACLSVRPSVRPSVRLCGMWHEASHLYILVKNNVESNRNKCKKKLGGEEAEKEKKEKEKMENKAERIYHFRQTSFASSLGGFTNKNFYCRKSQKLLLLTAVI